MLSMEAWTTIRYLHAQGKGVREISRELGLGRNTVRRAVRDATTPRYQRPARLNAKLAPFTAQIQAWVHRDHLIGSRILRELSKQGYQGKATALYAYLRTLKGSPAATKATERFETAPGQQGQFDWSPYTVEIGGQSVRVIIFGFTLGYSRRKHYTASRDEKAASIYEALEAAFWHFGGAPREVLLDNAKALVLDACPARFQWNARLLELCGHYRVRPRACKVRRAQTKGKVERPFFFLEQQFLKGRAFASWAELVQELAVFERDVLDVEVHHTTQEAPLARFADEQAHLLPLPAGRFVGTLTQTRKVSWDCMVSYAGTPYSVPASLAGQTVWLQVSQGRRLVVLDSRHEVVTEHELSVVKGRPVVNPAHYAALRQGQPRTLALLRAEFLRRQPLRQRFLEALIAEYRAHPELQLRPILACLERYDEASLTRAFHLAEAHATYSSAFFRGVLERDGALRTVAPPAGEAGRAPLPSTPVTPHLALYQQVLEQS
ncbi:MAG: IS21 family transposase [Chloroflexi bacterium]|nr:IS21 family transposase [Chloroflexota bacterium]